MGPNHIRGKRPGGTERSIAWVFIPGERCQGFQLTVPGRPGAEKVFGPTEGRPRQDASGGAVEVTDGDGGGDG